MEHLRNDQQALKEMARVMKPSGQLIITFPHRKFYFANDDCFVEHFRRYELHEMQDRLTGGGIEIGVNPEGAGPLGEDNHVR